MADKAIDNDLATFANTLCAWNKTVWYKMTFGAVFCFTEIVIINSHSSVYRYRMQDMKVFVVNTATKGESLCGILKTRYGPSVQGQTYKIRCNMKCGDEVKLTVYHESGDYDYEACIHMSEIMAFVSPGSCKWQKQTEHTVSKKLPEVPIKTLTFYVTP